MGTPHPEKSVQIPANAVADTTGCCHRWLRLNLDNTPTYRNQHVSLTRSSVISLWCNQCIEVTCTTHLSFG